MKKGYSKIDPEELGKKVLSIISKGLDVEITRDKDGMPKVLAIQKKKVG